MAEVVAHGIRHHVQVLGEGPRTVVFLHGLVMDNLSSWYFTAGAKAAAHSRVILMDLRGHGRTERPDSGYTVTTFMDDVLAVLDALDVQGPVHLVGNSFGGQLATSLAVHHPERVASLVLVDANLGGAGWGDAMAATLSLRGEDAEAAIALHFKDWLGRHSSRKRNRLADTAKALVLGTTLVADLQASPPLAEADIAKLTLPVLALYGAQSDIVHDAHTIGRLLPHADVHILEGATHSLIWEATDTVVGAIQTWLEAQ